MQTVRVQTGDTEQIVFVVFDSSGNPATGRTTIRSRIYRKSDNQFFDFADLTFKAGGHTTLDATMTEIDATNAAGHYELVGGFVTSTITNPNVDDTYVVVPSQTSGTDQLPDAGELTVGFWADDIGKIDDFVTTGPAGATTGSLLDRLANKDGAQTYNQATDSLEGIKDRIA